MLIVISPAKTLDFESKPTTQQYSMPSFLPQSEVLIEKLRKLSKEDIGDLMKISPQLAELNAERYANWDTDFTPENAKQAMLAFKGDVYLGLDAPSLSEEDLTFAQQHLRILSGLYGLLRPLDLMKPYRLEMGTKLPVDDKKNLYAFWDLQITEALNEAQSGEEKSVLVNLASNEYFKSVKPKSLNAEIITPVFKDEKNGKYKVISFYAKKARGMMAAFIIKNKLTEADQIKAFDTDGYIFNQELSKGNEWVFTRG